MSLRAFWQVALGRRVLMRVWLHSLALVVLIGVTAALVVYATLAQRAQWAPDVRAAKTVQLARRALGYRQEPDAIAGKLRDLAARGTVDISVFEGSDALVASSRTPPLAPLSGEERETLLKSGYVTTGSESPAGRCVAGEFDGGRLVAYAVAMRTGEEFLWQTWALVLSAVVLGIVLVSIPLARSIARPLENLGRLARKLGGGDLAVRAPDDRRDEIGDLARAFNDMAERIQRLRQAEREILADVSHELRTPLARMRVVVELAARGDLERTRRWLAEISSDLSELEQILADVFASSRLALDGESWHEARPPLRRQIVEVDAVAAAAAVRFRERWPQRALECHVSDEHLSVNGDRVMLRRALENFVDNARKYSAEDKPIRIAVARAELDGEPAVKVEVIDEGIGISPEDQLRVFNSFFRADRSRTRATGGVGLGLSLARRIVEAHGGTVGVTSEIDRGSRFWLVIPLARGELISGKA